MSFVRAKYFQQFVYSVGCLCWLFPAAIHAVEKAPISGMLQTDPMSSESIFKLLFGLVAVVFVFFASVWIMRRVGNFQAMNNAGLSVLGGVSVGPRERVVLIQVGDEQIVVGVAQGRVDKIHVMENPIPVKNNPEVSIPPFLRQFKEVMQKNVKNDETP